MAEAAGEIVAAAGLAEPGPAGAPVALLVVDDDCVVAEASLAACRLLGLARDDITGRPLAGLFAPAAAGRLQALWDSFHRSGGHAGPFEVAWPHGGSAVDVSVTAAVLPGRHLVVLSPATIHEAVAAPAKEPPAGASGRGPTARERQILAMLADGDTDIQIAEKLDLSPATVQTHVRNAKAKLGARTRAQAVVMALREGLISA